MELSEQVLIYVIMGLMMIGIGVLVYSFVKSIIAKRAYENAELPDIYEAEQEDEILPDVEESGFSTVHNDFDLEEESSVDNYDETAKNEDKS